MMERIGFMLRQSINLDGIRGFGSAMIHPSLLRPSLGHYHRVNDIDIADLHKTQGIKALVFDKDNTLTLPFHDVYFDKAVDEFMQKCKEIFSERNVAILSNSAGSPDDRNFHMAQATESALGVAVVRHPAAKKPGCWKEVLDHFGGEIKPEEICVIGDRVLTDVVFANTHSMKSILVDPFVDSGDVPVAAVLRSIERGVLLPFANRVAGNDPK